MNDIGQIKRTIIISLPVARDEYELRVGVLGAALAHSRQRRAQARRKRPARGTLRQKNIGEKRLFKKLF